MGTVVSLSPRAMDMVVFGDRSQQVMGYLQHQMNQFSTSAMNVGHSIMNSIQNSYNYLSNNLINYEIRDELANNGLLALDNYVQPLSTFEELQNANLTMQRWIMAHPTVREIYLDQNLDGYSDTYTNYDTGIGNDHYDYRRVMDGIIQTFDDDTYEIRHYLDELKEGDKPLDHYDKVNILHTWAAMDHFLDTCKFDFTRQSEEPEEMNI